MSVTRETSPFFFFFKYTLFSSGVSSPIPPGPSSSRSILQHSSRTSSRLGPGPFRLNLTFRRRWATGSTPPPPPSQKMFGSILHSIHLPERHARVTSIYDLKLFRTIFFIILKYFKPVPENSPRMNTRVSPTTRCNSFRIHFCKFSSEFYKWFYNDVFFFYLSSFFCKNIFHQNISSDPYTLV